MLCWALFDCKTLFNKLWLPFEKRAKLDLRLTKTFLFVTNQLFLKVCGRIGTLLFENIFLKKVFCKKNLVASSIRVHVDKIIDVTSFLVFHTKVTVNIGLKGYQEWYHPFYE